MAKTLVVMRHGKAMPLAQGQKDKDRKLTEAGARSLARRLPYMLGLFEVPDGEVQLWVSPAKRARQTAALLEEALREQHVHLAKSIEIHESLWEQDLDGFLNELRESDATTIFAVGHVPFVEDVVYELAGTTPPFSTGALGCLEVHLAEEDAQELLAAHDYARLLWFAQGPVAAHWETLQQLQATITQTAEVIEERRTAFFACPSDIETIHRFRTNSRTLRSFIAFIKPWQNKQQNAETQELLRDIVRYTSRLRELDVLEKQVRMRTDVSPKLVAFCEKEASAERAKVLKTLSSKHVTRMFERAMALAKNVTWKKRIAALGLPAQVARARFDAIIESVGSELDALDLADAEQTHDVRKRAKRARYVAEFNEAILGADSVDIARNMMAHQDHLGDVCDARANIRLIDEFLQQKLPKSVVSDLTMMRAQNEAYLQEVLGQR